MIYALIVVNNYGKPRISKFYHEGYGDVSLQQRLVQETYHLVSKRGSYMCNFIEGTGTGWGDGLKLIYRVYATLYFVAVVDEGESELGILDLIHTVVETVDRCFKNGSELDVIFNFTKVHAIIDEIIQAGLVCETDKEIIFGNLVEQKKVERSEDPISNSIDSGVDNIIDVIQNRLRRN
eukprot:TRINITY_DN12065_c0_g1_i1.p1 TRINITY_DN12065_c0_g1~~TRINITY_DN12065_c0_g1_i1.p1  ORF type:complete len:179 (-),score=42.69 TRINITY_DN12065_c0_g1_i1:61-597(-)